jgi:hypothetical protein
MDQTVSPQHLPLFRDHSDLKKGLQNGGHCGQVGVRSGLPYQEMN